MFTYFPLDPRKREIRVLTLVDPPKESDRIHCVLEHVSLADFSSEFSEFLKRNSFEGGGEIVSKAWLKATESRDRQYKRTRRVKDLRLYLWRKQVQEAVAGGRELDIGEIWEQLQVTGSGAHLIQSLNTQGLSLEPSVPLLCPRFHDPITKMFVKSAKAQGPRTFSLSPRFNWGDYEAISYSWESTKRDSTILINGSEVSVSKNVELLLRQLTGLPETSSGMKYWIDALCIDQSNTEERNRQVQLMRKIYKMAFAVVVWLGSSVYGSDKAIDFVTRIGLFELHRQGAGNGAIVNEYSPWRNFNSTGGSRESPWNEMLAFLSCTYWNRLWIIQELALNHNMTLFIWGDSQLCRSLLQKAFDAYEILASKLDLGTLPIRDRMYKAKDLIELSDQKFASTGLPFEWNIRLDSILNVGRRAQSSDPRDKVYGLLGLLSPHIEENISPDYGLTKQEVYVQFAAAILRTYKRLDHLLERCSPEFLSDIWPTWVPDWTDRYGRNSVKVKKYQASGRTESICAVIPGSHSLTCRGFFVDQIQETSGLMIKFTDPHDIHTTETPEINITTTLSQTLSHATYQELREKLARTFHLGFLPPGDLGILDFPWLDWDATVTSFAHKHSILIWHSFAVFRQQNSQFSIFGYTLREFFHAPQANLQLEDHSDVIIEITENLDGRRLITTKDKDIGMASGGVQKGDVIAILYGCNFPVVLRPFGDYYRYMGESYVDSLMWGEKMDDKEKGNYEETDIVLF